MFESGVLPEEAQISACPTAALVDTMAEAQRLERVCVARRLFAVAELFFRREAEEDTEDRASWRVDGWDAVAAEVAAAQGISRAKAAGQIRLATTLRENLPKVAEVFAAGLVDLWIIHAIVSRTFLICAATDKARIDAALARRVHRWNKLSQRRVTELIDQWVVTVDTLAKRPDRRPDDDRGIDIDPDHNGMGYLVGMLRPTDAAALDARLDALADTVCRTKAQRRADAAGALAFGLDRLACTCQRQDCPAQDTDTPHRDVVIHVLADHATIAGQAPIPGYIPGFGVLPAEIVRQLVPTARLRPLTHPGQAGPEPRYQPSRALADFVRFRDLRCRFPGCDVPAAACDIDHTRAHPAGPTHASNLKLLCRHHHLLKTFYTGPHGWTDTQHPDGTVIWTSPTGHTYTTTPGGALLFPQLQTPTAKLVLPEDIPHHPDRGLRMPTRDRTRAQDRQDRIDYERELNRQHHQTQRDIQQRASDADPPPF